MTPFKPVPEEALSLEIPLKSMEPPLDWSALFGRAATNAIEIGTGNGVFLASEAAKLPGFNFIGIERDLEFYYKMVRRVHAASLANVRTTPADALDVLEHWIPPASVARIYCYFSDPWPKRRHAARRVLSPANLPLIERVLIPGGEFRFKTDVGYYFNLAITALRKQSGWTIVESARLPPPDVAKGEVVTNFERKAREAGSEVWGLIARYHEPSPASCSCSCS
ncbi:tRNA (guanosine(46)-N7)-methyltransferase TrmB [bacterium]|nr:tRNA (guanosine(46)-N7)-methyltransferase TrmB [bacterium]